MGDAKKGAGDGQIPARDAVDWFVENESDRELDGATLLQWERWCTHPRNRAQCTSVVQMFQQIRLLPAPSAASGEELLGDLLGEPGPRSDLS
jgi:hypothetical protein